jgi:hypothetical protein
MWDHLTNQPIFGPAPAPGETPSMTALIDALKLPTPNNSPAVQAAQSGLAAASKALGASQTPFQQIRSDHKHNPNTMIQGSMQPVGTLMPVFGR